MSSNLCRPCSQVCVTPTRHETWITLHGATIGETIGKTSSAAQTRGVGNRFFVSWMPIDTCVSSRLTWRSIPQRTQLNIIGVQTQAKTQCSILCGYFTQFKIIQQTTAALKLLSNFAITLVFARPWPECLPYFTYIYLLIWRHYRLLCKGTVTVMMVHLCPKQSLYGHYNV